MNTSAYYHAAVDPNLQYNWDAERWKVSPHDDGRSMLWAEANWPMQIGVRFYVKESPTATVTMLTTGISLLVTSVFVVWRLQKYCQRKFLILRW